MKLYYAQTSPFVRKVMIVAHELGLADRIELVPSAVSPVKRNPGVLEQNPLGKIPVLVTDKGVSLYDSSVICQYLDSIAGDGGIVPEGMARWVALRDEALSDGMLDAAVLIRYETAIRPEAQRWQDWIDGKMAAIHDGLKAIDGEAATFGDRLDIGVIAAACVLGYLDFRFPDLDWARAYPQAARWFATFKTRPSFQATMPA